MVVDEAHFIKNKTSQRSQNVLQLVRADPRPHRPAAADGADRHAADQRHRGLPGDLAVPRLDRRQEAARRADGRARGDRPDAGRPRLLPGGPHQRRRPGHRPSSQGRRRRRHPGPPDRRPPRRARRRDRPLDPRGRARARPAPAWRATRRRWRPARRAELGRRRHRPRAGPPGRDVGARGHHRRVHRRERLQHDAPDRPGQGRSRRRLRRPAGAQRRQGRLLRQAHRRDGRRRGRPSPSAACATPRSAATRPEPPASAASRRSWRTRTSP